MVEPEVGTNPPNDERLTQAEALARKVFGGDTDLDGPILGAEVTDVVAPNVHEMILDPNNTVATLAENGTVVGFSIAVPIGSMDARRKAETSETAYIYFTAIEPTRQGSGLVGILMEDMEDKLRTQGYSYMERDCVLTQGYADSVEKSYGEAIVTKYDHTKWPEIGPERFFRIDLSKV